MLAAWTMMTMMMVAMVGDCGGDGNCDDDGCNGDRDGDGNYGSDGNDYDIMMQAFLEYRKLRSIHPMGAARE